MKKFFDKENFLISSFSKEEKRQSLVLALVTILCFIITSFVFLNGFYGFVDVIGSIVSGSVDVAIKDLTRSIPLILPIFMSIWALLLLQATFRRVSDERWHKSLKKDAICLIAFAGANILYIIIGLIIGKYSSIVEGSPSYIYPLDSFFYSLLFAALGTLIIFYLRKYEAKLPLNIPGRSDIVTKARGAYCTFVSFWLLIALFGFSAGIYTIFIYDFRHEFAFYGIATVLVYLLSPIQLLVWEFYYNELKKEKKKEFLFPLALCSLCVSVLFAVLYIASLSVGLDAPSNAGFGMFPVAFAASVNIATLVMVFTPVIVSVVALVKGILLKKKAE